MNQMAWLESDDHVTRPGRATPVRTAHPPCDGAVFREVAGRITYAESPGTPGIGERLVASG
jgi:hypothetical protein